MLRTFFNTFQYLSLPVVVGAVFSHRMAVRMAGADANVSVLTTVVLALVVWAIYTADRLLDVRQTGFPETPRHRFHAERSELLWWGVGMALLIAGVLSFWLPAGTVRFGLVLGAVCLLYGLAVHRLPINHPALLLKEPVVAVVFTAGVWGSVWSQTGMLTGAEWWAGVLFMAVAFQNLLVFSLMESLNAPDALAPTLATVWGYDRCDTYLRWLTFAVVAGAFIICFTTSDRFTQRSALMLGAMSSVLYVIQRYPAYFLTNDRYRFFGDAVFWLPALVL